MRAESLLREKNRLLDKLAKTAWAETAIFLALTVCFLFFIKPGKSQRIKYCFLIACSQHSGKSGQKDLRRFLRIQIGNF